MSDHEITLEALSSQILKLVQQLRSLSFFFCWLIYGCLVVRGRSPLQAHLYLVYFNFQLDPGIRLIAEFSLSPHWVNQSPAPTLPPGPFPTPATTTGAAAATTTITSTACVRRSSHFRRTSAYTAPFPMTIRSGV